MTRFVSKIRCMFQRIWYVMLNFGGVVYDAIGVYLPSLTALVKMSFLFLVTERFEWHFDGQITERFV